MTTPTLRSLLAQPTVTLIASVQDALTAQLAARAGFEVAVVGGATVTNSLLGLPDSGFITLTEMQFVVERIAAATEIPIIVDTDSGYGNAVNVIRTVRCLEQAGAAGMFFEDQVSPPRGAAAGVALVSATEMAGKVRAAVDARTDDSFLIIARSDARRIEGLDATLDRARQYVDAGADAFFAAGVLDPTELARVAAEVGEVFHVGYLAGPPAPSATEFETMGYACVVTGVNPVRAGALATYQLYEQYFTHREPVGDPLAASALENWNEITGFGWLQDVERRYLAAEELDLRYGSGEA